MYKLGMTKIEELIKNIYNKTRKFFLINFFKKKILSSIKLDVIENNSFGYVAKSDFQEFKNEEYFSKFIGSIYKLYIFNFFLIENECSKKIYLTSHYENNEFYTLSLFKKFYKKFNFIDVGSHMGFYSVFIKKLFGSSSKILSIDCIDSNLNYQKKVFQLNNLSLDNVYFEKILISDKNYYYHNSFFDGLTSTSKNNLEYSKFNFIKTTMQPTLKIDTILKKYSFDTIDFLKIDIEGEEFFFVNNHLDLIKKNLPVIQFEINVLLYSQEKIQDIINCFNNIGYEMFQISANKSKKKIDFILVKNTNQITESQNLLLLNKNNYIHRDILINLY